MKFLFCTSKNCSFETDHDFNSSTRYVHNEFDKRIIMCKSNCCKSNCTYRHIDIKKSIQVYLDNDYTLNMLLLYYPVKDFNGYFTAKELLEATVKLDKIEEGYSYIEICCSFNKLEEMEEFITLDYVYQKLHDSTKLVLMNTFESIIQHFGFDNVLVRLKKYNWFYTKFTVCLLKGFKKDCKFFREQGFSSYQLLFKKGFSIKEIAESFEASDYASFLSYYNLNDVPKK